MKGQIVSMSLLESHCQPHIDVEYINTPNLS